MSKKYGFEDSAGNSHTFRCPQRCIAAAIKHAKACTEVYGGEIHLECDSIPIFTEDDHSVIVVGQVDLAHDDVAQRTQEAQGHPTEPNSYVASVCAINRAGMKLFRKYSLDDVKIWFGECPTNDPRQISMF
jgi:hypothetical protein